MEGLDYDCEVGKGWDQKSGLQGYLFTTDSYFDPAVANPAARNYIPISQVTGRWFGNHFYILALWPLEELLRAVLLTHITRQLHGIHTDPIHTAAQLKTDYLYNPKKVFNYCHLAIFKQYSPLQVLLIHAQWASLPMGFTAPTVVYA